MTARKVSHVECAHVFNLNSWKRRKVSSNNAPRYDHTTQVAVKEILTRPSEDTHLKYCRPQLMSLVR